MTSMADGPPPHFLVLIRDHVVPAIEEDAVGLWEAYGIMWLHVAF